MGRIILEHVDHVLKVDERVIDCDDFNFFVVEGSSQYESSNSTESIDTNFKSHFLL